MKSCQVAACLCSVGFGVKTDIRNIRLLHFKYLEFAGGFGFVVCADNANPTGIHRAAEYHALRYRVVEYVSELAYGLHTLPFGAVIACFRNIFEYRFFVFCRRVYESCYFCIASGITYES